MEKNQSHKRGKKLCGAVLKSGLTCKQRVKDGTKRCRRHRGKRNGPNDTKRTRFNSSTTNVYSHVLSEEDALLVEELQEMEGLNDEIALVRYRINRTLLALRKIEEADPNNPNNTEGMQIEEIKRTGSSAGHVISRRPHFESLLDRWIGRLAQLLKTRAEISGDGEQMSREQLKDRILSDLALAQTLTIGHHNERREQCEDSTE